MNQFVINTAENSGDCSKKTPVLKAVLFILIFALVFCGISYLFQPVWYTWSNYDTVHGIYEEPENTIEAIFLGPSVIANGIIPIEMYADYGIAAYNMGLEQQPTLVSYYWLKEAYRLNSETLKIAVLDVGGLRRDVSIPYYRKGLDAMKFSSDKLEAVKEYAGGSVSNAISYLVPLFSYHSRWSDLVKNDFTKKDYAVKRYLRGYNFTTGILFRSNSSPALPAYYPELDVKGAVFTTEAFDYLDRIADFCSEHGIRLILMRTPGQSIGLAAHEMIQSLADERGLPFLDFDYEPLLSEVGVNFAVDKMDNSHLNYYGALKLTNWFGRFLTEECGATDVRGKDGFEFLEEQLREYRERVEEVIALKAIGDPAEYLARVCSDPDFITFIALRDEGSQGLTDAQRKIFSELGLPLLSELSYRASYLAVIDGGAVLYEATDPDPSSLEEGVELVDKESDKPLTISWQGNLSDGTPVSLTSGGRNLGKTASVLIDGKEQAGNSRGLNIVVYNKKTGSVADSSVYDTYSYSSRAGDAMEAKLAAALDQGASYTSLYPILQNLYLYDRKCEDRLLAVTLDRTTGDEGLLLYLDRVMSNEDYCVFLSVNGDAAKRFTDESRAWLAQKGLPVLAKLKKGNSYLGVIAGGEVLFEQRDKGTEPIRYESFWYSGKPGTYDVTYRLSSAGGNAGKSASIIINGIEYTSGMRGLNLVVWNTLTDQVVLTRAFNTHAVSPLLPSEAESEGTS